MNKFQKTIVNLIYKSDFIGIKPGLFVQRSKRFTTLFGGLLCILISLTMFVAFLYFSQDFIFYLNPSETKSTVYSQHPKSISLLTNDTFSNLDLNIKINSGNEILSRDYYNLIVESQIDVVCNMDLNSPDDMFKNSYPDITSNENDISLIAKTKSKICSLPLSETINSRINDDYNQRTFIKRHKTTDCSVGTNDFSKLNTKINKNTSICLDMTEIEDLNIFGNEFYSVYKTINFYFQKCIDNCPSDLNEKWNSQISLNIYHKNFIYDLRSYNDPIFFHPDVISGHYIENYESRVKVIMKNTNINTDIGYILEDYREKNVVVKDKTIHSIINQTIKSNNKNLISIQFEASPTVDLIYRKYIKVQRILAELGGLFKTFVIMALILNYFDNRAKYLQHLFNELFSIEDLGKYFQYFDPSLRTKFHKFRDSIILKNTKTETLIRKADPNNYIPSNRINKTETKTSKMQNINQIDRSRGLLLHSNTKHSKTSTARKDILLNVDYNNSSLVSSSKNDKTNTEQRKNEINEIAQMLKKSPIREIRDLNEEIVERINNNDMHQVQIKKDTPKSTTLIQESKTTSNNQNNCKYIF